jgi:AmiR/NasT family two-component response regulator
MVSALDADAVVHQATGVLMVRNGTTIEQATADLRAQANAAGRHIFYVAREIVYSVGTAP